MVVKRCSCGMLMQATDTKNQKKDVCVAIRLFVLGNVGNNSPVFFFRNRSIASNREGHIGAMGPQGPVIPPFSSDANQNTQEVKMNAI